MHYPREVFSLLPRAAAALLLGVAFVMGAFWHMAQTWPAFFWLVFVPILGLSAWRGLRDRERRQQAMAERLCDEHVPSMSPIEYERFAARQLERAGWKVTHCGHTGDQGCDVVAELRGFRAVVQCKLYRKRCGNAAVQQIAAARRHYDAQVMAVVCPAGFTSSAIALAQTNGVHLMHHSALPALEALARIP